MRTPEKFSLLFTLGTIITYGALGFVGMLEFTKLYFICGTAFLFSGLIEGQVYWEKIAAAIQSFFDENHLQRSILRKKLQHYINDDRLKKNYFLEKYRDVCLQLIKLYGLKDSITAAQQDEIHYLNERLQMMENFLLKWIRKKKTETSLSTETPIETSVLEFINATGNTFDDIDQLAAAKKNWLYMGGFLSVGAGIGSYFATLGAFKIGFALLGISLAGGPFGIFFAIVLFGAAGYALSLYQSILEVVKKYDSLNELSNEISNFFINSSWEKRLAMVLVVAFTVFAVLATAGTWFKLINNGASLVPMINRVASVIQFFSIIVMAVPSFIYSLVNTCESFHRIDRHLSHPKKWENLKISFRTCYQTIQNTWKKENLLQFINPFRIITEVLEGLIFLAHLTSMAVGNDQFPEKISSTLTGIAIEGFTDAPALFPDSQETTEPSDARENQAIQLDKLEDKHHNQSEIFTEIILFVPRCLGVLWDWVLGALWFYGVTNFIQAEGPSDTSVKAPNWQDAKDKLFKKKKDNSVKAFQPSDAWISQELIEHCNQYKDQQGTPPPTSLSANKLNQINELRDNLAKNQANAIFVEKNPKELNSFHSSNQILNESNEKNKLLFATHRNCVFSRLSSTKTTQFMKTLNEKCSFSY